jgi:ubiquinol-cytochrome c reductase cytochrome b subunit
MRASFLGYVLPFGQMSFWRATVIVNLLSVIPFVRGSICILAWGGFCVSYFTVKRFFTFHFLLPFVILVLVLRHLLLLHFYGSNSTNLSFHRVSFFKLFFVKDFLSWVLFFISLTFLYSIEINKLGDVENYLISNPIQTPLHIKPEWYFLFAYSILRCIPSKSGGVLALALSVIIPIILSVTSKFGVLFCFRLLLFFVLLTVTRSIPVEEPYVLFSQFVSIRYFLVYFFGF